MSSQFNGSIAALGYRQRPCVDFADVVADIDKILQAVDPEPSTIHWASDHIALIDRESLRIGLGCAQGSDGGPYTHLVIAVGAIPGQSEEQDNLHGVSCVHLADKLVLRIKDDMPYDTIMRGETPEPVEPKLIETMFELLRISPGLSADGKPPEPSTRTANPSDAQFDVIDAHDVEHPSHGLSRWLEKRAVPSKPLRLTVHTVGLSVMLHTAPLGAFMLTYSLLRDMSGKT